ncbi:HNH endonuclease signature motif containing protein [Variovorax sp. PBL-H6]|uniref:HNH endonuclease signature motif containing protein n=1 Tax=Variovorax sp. PBL-H6 TaxID=434009 RepID=UPI0015757F64|nr:HNH endonuclease signature motif containing protein [Variovorax sp. PBL-H6]
MLKPRLTTLPDRLQALKPSKAANRSGRDADPRRTLSLNTAAWQRLRASVLAGEPLCRQCTAEGRTTVATDVDHRDGNPGNNDALNLQPLCHSCHSRKTAADHGKRVTMGCDADGMPLDPAHPWNATVARLLEKSPATENARPGASSRVTANRKDRP